MESAVGEYVEGRGGYRVNATGNYTHDRGAAVGVLDVTPARDKPLHTDVLSVSHPYKCTGIVGRTGAGRGEQHRVIRFT